MAPVAAPARRKPGLRIAASVLAVLIVLGAAGALARVWVMQQYYVGVDGTQVAIFQGVRGDVLGFPLHEVAEHSDITIDELTESDRSAVSDGIIAADGLDGARGLVSRLRDRMLKPCPVISATTTPAPPVAAPTPAAAAPAPGAPPAAPAPTPNTTPLPSATAIPGVNCRPVS
jgi:protein phosphatase